MHSSQKQNHTGNWLLRPGPKASAKYRLFCFPYAGGNASTFYHWNDLLGQDIELNLVQLPGRGARFNEPLITCMDELVQHLVVALKEQLDKPYAFFGHSLGSRVAFSLLTKLASQELPQPRHFFASGSRAPHMAIDHLPKSDLDDKAFCAAIADMGGTPDTLLAHPELMELALPALKADFQLAESFIYSGKYRYDPELTLFTGTRDPLVTESTVLAWQQHFQRFGALYRIDGNHFFLEQKGQEIVRQINELMLS